MSGDANFKRGRPKSLTSLPIFRDIEIYLDLFHIKPRKHHGYVSCSQSVRGLYFSLMIHRGHWVPSVSKMNKKEENKEGLQSESIRKCGSPL